VVEVYMAKKKKMLHGRVKKTIKSVAAEPEKVEITIEEADDLYKEIRVENVVTDEKGKKSKLTPDEEVDVVIETDDDKKDG
jgi:hypothetical protein